ncbi:hypothetical protein L1049_015556 [Liquidambar formosana]|uniref:Uncharacterized protein n=1 Tax=Liquidambar formosana TaxID=63359 RepID=A0AAP0RXR5_LIQFO
MTVHDEEENSAVQQQRLKESQEKHKKSKIYENFRFENPMLLKLCGTLFPENPRSVWSGPHSLVQQQGSGRSSSIHAAIATFMK